jgi:plasmid stabilization system protein ParE
VTLRLTPEAEDDLADTYAWYEEQRAGLGDAFLRALDATIASVQRQPEAHQLVDETMRRALLRRFTYGVFFEVVAKEIVVYGILHCARDPKSWKRRRDA